MLRYKHPEADLKLAYPKVMARSVGISVVFLLVLAVMFPSFEMETPARVRRPDVIIVEQIPVIRHPRRPEPKRPSIPIEADADEVPEDVTIESTELDLERVPVELPAPVRRETAHVEEEVLEFWRVERQPVLIRGTMPVYPEMAKRAGLEGVVFVAFTVGADGSVRQVRAVRGPEIFRKAAIEAVSQFVFEPAVQNDRVVAVKMSMPIRFRLND
ncbi:MAG: energy transducer TonB [Gemmatimonadota bacterium]|nr:energy transducer TonB [Gemmatimonadota bacterium]